MRATWIAIVFAIVGVAAAAAPAHAQGYGPGYYAGPPPPPRGVVRSGFIAGVAIGGGAFGIVDCDDCEGTGALSLRGHLGGMLAPNLALMFDLESASGPFGDDAVITQTTAMGVLRVWLGRIFYLQGGLGLAWLRLSTEGGGLAITSEAGGAIMGGLGVELMQRPSFTIDLSLRLIGSRYGGDDEDGGFGVGGGTLLVGFNWY
jgi:hypothetical protein